MPRPPRSPSKVLRVALGVFLFASLVHFIHNALYLKDYPGLPVTWNGFGVMAVWLVIAAVGLLGERLLRRYPLLGLGLISMSAVAGLDSLGHYVVADFTAHTRAMNGTILFEVTAAAVLLSACLFAVVMQLKVKNV